MKIHTDIIIVGTGVAGLFCALNLPSDKKIYIISKSKLEESDSFLAQGGICIQKDADDYESFLEDTLKAGHYENDTAAVSQMITDSPDIIKDLAAFQVDFEQENGSYKYTKEGAHSKARILYHKDVTGREITSKLLDQVKKRNNIEIFEYTEMIDLVCDQNCCTGVIIANKDGIMTQMDANYFVMATGGIGGLFQNSTNYSHLTGDALALAIKHNIERQNMNYIQIHPTALYSLKPGRRFLISESIRGEGAYLYNQKLERFVDELLPRDQLTKEIYKQMELEGSNHVWLSVKHVDSNIVKERFPNIFEYCLAEGIDITKDYIPVTPAQHYFMGGIKVDLNSRTSMERLYAVGETSCNGVHGANRLASNSLLESLVFAKRAAIDIAKNYMENAVARTVVNLDSYRDLDQIRAEHMKMVRNEMERNDIDERFNHL